MDHFICAGGCGGEADSSGVCQAENCEKSGKPLEECNCEDGSHKNIEDDTTDENEDER